MFNTTDPGPRNDLVSRLKKKKQLRLVRLNSVLDEVLFAQREPFSVYREYMQYPRGTKTPEEKPKPAGGIFGKSPAGRKVGAAIGEKLPAEEIYEGGYRERWKRTSEKGKGPGGTTKRGIEQMRVHKKEGFTPATKPHFVVVGTKERLKYPEGHAKAGKLVTTEAEREAFHQDFPNIRTQQIDYPLYTKGAQRFKREQFVRAMYDIQPEEVIHTPEGELKPRTSTVDREAIAKMRKEEEHKGTPVGEINARAARMRDEGIARYKSTMRAALSKRLGSKELDDKINRELDTQIQRLRNVAAGELGGLREITQSRRRFLGKNRPYVATPKDPGVIEHYKAKLGGLVKEKQNVYENILTRGEARLRGHLQSGIMKDNPALHPDEAARQAEDLSRHISHPLTEPPYPGAMNPQKRVDIAKYLSSGSGKNVTPETVDRIHAHMYQMRDLATRPGQKPTFQRRGAELLTGARERLSVRERVLLSGRMWRDVPKPTFGGYPHLASLGKGAAIAALAGGGLLAARNLWKRRQQQPEPQSRPKLYGMPRYDENPEPYNRLKRSRPAGTRFASKMKEIRFAKVIPFKQGIPYSAAKKLVTKIRLSTLRRASNQGLLNTAVGEGLNLREQKIKAAEAGLETGVKKHLESIAAFEHEKSQWAEKNRNLIPQERAEAAAEAARREGYAEARSDIKGHAEDFERNLKQKSAEELERSRRRLHIGVGTAAVGGLGAGYLVGRSRRKQPSQERQFGILHDIATGAIEASVAYPITERLVKRFSPKGASLTRKLLVSGAIGGAATGLIGTGLNLFKPKKKKHEMISKLRLIRFQDDDYGAYMRPPSRAQVVRDRYMKQIHAREIDRANKHYLRSAGAGAALGLALRKTMPLRQAAGVGALAGLGAQYAARRLAKSTKDPFGEETYAGKRLEKAPSIIGAGAAGIIGVRKLLKGIKSVKLSARNKLIRFQEEPEDEFTQRYQKWAHRKLYAKRVRKPTRVAEDVKKWYGRVSRFKRDIQIHRSGVPNLDERGRPRRPEWDKPWVKALIGTAAIASPFVAYKGLRKIIQSVPVESRIGQWRESFARGDYLKGVAQKVSQSKPAKFYQGVKSDVKKIISKPVAKPKYESSIMTPSGGLKSKGAIAREEEEVAAKQEIYRHAQPKPDVGGFPREGRVPNAPPGTQPYGWKPPPKPPKSGASPEVKQKWMEQNRKYWEEQRKTAHERKRGEEERFRSKLKLIQFQYDDDYPTWDIAHRSSRSAIVYSPKSRPRQRREKEWYERKANQRLLWEGALAGTGGLGLLGVYAAARHGKIAGLRRGLRSGARRTAAEEAGKEAGKASVPQIRVVVTPNPNPRPKHEYFKSKLKVIRFEDEDEDHPIRRATEQGALIAGTIFGGQWAARKAGQVGKRLLVAPTQQAGHQVAGGLRTLGRGIATGARRAVGGLGYAARDVGKAWSQTAGEINEALRKVPTGIKTGLRKVGGVLGSALTRPAYAGGIRWNAKGRVIRFKAEDQQITKKAISGASGTGLALGTYALLRRRTALPATASPVLRKLRQAAEEHGLARVTLHPRVGERPLSKGPTWWQKLSTEITQPADIHRHITEQQSHSIKRFKGAIFDPDETGALVGGKVIGKPTRIAKQIEKGKLEEYRATKKAGMSGMPLTLPVPSAMELKPGFVAKPARGSMSKSVITPEMVRNFNPESPRLARFKFYRKHALKRIKDQTKLATALTSHPGWKEYQTEQLIRYPKKFVQQHKIDIAKEYRVHLLGGRRLGISSGRFGLTGRTSPAEGAAENFLKRASPELKKNLLAMDIARTKQGKWNVIETNPGAGSGFLTPSRKYDIRGPNKLYKVLTGRYSKPYAGTAAVGVGTAGTLGTYAATTRNDRKPRS